MTSIPETPACSPASTSGRRDTGKPGGRAEAARRLDDANKLLDEVHNGAAERSCPQVLQRRTGRADG